MRRGTFSGFETAITNTWKDKFDELYNDDGQIVAVSKETFHHDDGPESDLSFDYKYVIEGIDLGMCCPEAKIIIKLWLVPCTSCWSEKALKDAAKLFGYEEYSLDELRGMMNEQDALSAGYAVPFGDEMFPYDGDKYDEGFYDLTDNDEAVEKMDTIASIMDAANSLRGFMMDSAWNMLGNTGWDIIEQVKNDQDMTKAALERWEGRQAAV